MNDRYSPTVGAKPEGSLFTAQLSQRDLGLQIPINYVTRPGVSISAACFPSLRYEDDEFGNCLSNLLAVGFRKLEIDLYFDQAQRVWSLCPVTVPNSGSAIIFPTTPNIRASSSPLDGLETGTVGANATLSSISDQPPLSSLLGELQVRQVLSNTTSRILDATGVSSTSSATGTIDQIPPNVSTVPSSSNFPLFSLGVYQCTATINLSKFIAQLLDYIEVTENTIDANLIYLFFNLHLASSHSNQTASVSALLNPPDPSELIGTIFSGNLSGYIYSPSNLFGDRANLNDSWNRVSANYRPVDGYYEMINNQNNFVSTEDGWPSEGYIEFSRSKRALLSWGTVDPQMAGYDFEADSDFIFDRDYIDNSRLNISTTSTGEVTRGCFVLDSTNNDVRSNSSWASGSRLTGFTYPITPTADIQPLIDLNQNLTRCGISPFLNTTLLSYSASSNFTPYASYTASSIWSWSRNEPRNATLSAEENPSAVFRCAATNSETGRWHVADCSDRFFAACRSRSHPFNWTLTTYELSYSFARDACPDDFDFAVPRTALENSYLTKRIREGGQRVENEPGRDDGIGRGRVWVDFNSLDTLGCWVTGGPNATCPYRNGGVEEDELSRRIILVPTVAAIIVFILTGLTIFLKCAGNRNTRRTKNRRIKRRAENGFVYEGVPS